MTEAQKALVRRELSRIAAEDAGRAPDETLSARFYVLLFERAPSVRPLFKGDLKAQRIKFADMLALTVGAIDRLDNLVPVLWQSGKRHRGYGAAAEHYALVGDALLAAIAERTTGPDAPEALRALGELYATIAEVMRAAAEEEGEDKAL